MKFKLSGKGLWEQLPIGWEMCNKVIIEGEPVEEPCVCSNRDSHLKFCPEWKGIEELRQTDFFELPVHALGKKINEIIKYINSCKN